MHHFLVTYIYIEMYLECYDVIEFKRKTKQDTTNV